MPAPKTSTTCSRVCPRILGFSKHSDNAATRRAIWRYLSTCNRISCYFSLLLRYFLCDCENQGHIFLIPFYFVSFLIFIAYWYWYAKFFAIVVISCQNYCSFSSCAWARGHKSWKCAHEFKRLPERRYVFYSQANFLWSKLLPYCLRLCLATVLMLNCFNKTESRTGIGKRVLTLRSHWILKIGI